MNHTTSSTLTITEHMRAQSRHAQALSYTLWYLESHNVPEEPPEGSGCAPCVFYR